MGAKNLIETESTLKWTNKLKLFVTVRSTNNIKRREHVSHFPYNVDTKIKFETKPILSEHKYLKGANILTSKHEAEIKTLKD